MRCLVTGAAGFIGNTLVKRLIKEGHKVKGLIHVTTPRYLVNNVEYISGDITDRESIKPSVKDVDVVFHCAAFVKDFGPKKKIYKVNLEGAKNLVEACEEFGVKRFIFLSHIMYESGKKMGYYSKTKVLAEQYLNEKHRKNKFPVVVIRPGNVYGPGATTWVLKPLIAIKKNRIALIDGERGIFLHTYIDNLLDALMAAVKEPKAVGETIDVTDGDNSVTWGKYLNDLAMMAGESPIQRNISKKSALVIGEVMLLLHKIFRIEPWVTPTAVNIFTNKKTVSIDKAKKLLGYNPKIDYNEGIERVRKWLQNEHYI